MSARKKGARALVSVLFSLLRCPFCCFFFPSRQTNRQPCRLITGKHPVLLTNKKRQRVILSWAPSRLSGTVTLHRFPSLQSDYYLSRDQTQWCCVILRDETHNGCTGNYVFLEIMKAVSSVDKSTWKYGSR